MLPKEKLPPCCSVLFCSVLRRFKIIAVMLAAHPQAASDIRNYFIATHLRTVQAGVPTALVSVEGKIPAQEAGSLSVSNYGVIPVPGRNNVRLKPVIFRKNVYISFVIKGYAQYFTVQNRTSSDYLVKQGE